MRKDIAEKIVIENVKVELVKKPNSYLIRISANGKQNEREFKLGKKIIMSIENSTLVISAKAGTKKEKRLIETVKAHIKNMIRGVIQPWVYKLEICYSHFPISVSIDEKARQIVIKNFSGEKVPRYVQLLEGVNVAIKGNIIEVSSIDKELAGRQAALIESATKIKEKDRRIFQDGIWIIEKAGKPV